MFSVMCAKPGYADMWVNTELTRATSTSSEASKQVQLPHPARLSHLMSLKLGLRGMCMLAGVSGPTVMAESNEKPSPFLWLKF